MKGSIQDFFFMGRQYQYKPYYLYAVTHSDTYRLNEWVPMAKCFVNLAQNHPHYVDIRRICDMWINSNMGLDLQDFIEKLGLNEVP